LRFSADGLRGPGGPDAAFVEARRLPELASGLDRVDAGGVPPRPLVAGAMRSAMMGAAEWDREFGDPGPLSTASKDRRRSLNVTFCVSITL